MSIEITIDGNQEIQDFLRSLPDELFNGAKQTFAKAILKAQTVIRTDNFTSGNAGYASNKLNSRTGELSRSIRTEINGNNLNDLNGRVYTVSPYAKIHELGGTVNAKNKYLGVPGGPYLNIPLRNNLTAAGVMKKSAREVFFEGGFIVKSKMGNWLVMDVAGIPMFVLKRSVYIKPRLGMVKASEDRIPEILNDLRNLRID